MAWQIGRGGLGYRTANDRIGMFNPSDTRNQNARSYAAASKDPAPTESEAFLVSDPYILGTGRRRNLLDNGAMAIWQRQIFSNNTTNGCHTADRWITTAANGSGRACEYRQVDVEPLEIRVTQTDLPAERHYLPVRYAFQWHEKTPGTGYTEKALWTPIEDTNVLSGRALTLSFWARSRFGNMTLPGLRLDYGSATQASPSGYINGLARKTEAINITSEWQRFTWTFRPPVFLADNRYFYDTGAFTTNYTDDAGISYLVWELPTDQEFIFEMTAVQLEYGRGPSDFELRGRECDLELCERRYQKSYPDRVFPGHVAPEAWPNLFGYELQIQDGGGDHYVTFPVVMNSEPVVSVYAYRKDSSPGKANYWYNGTNSVNAGVTPAYTYYQSEKGFIIGLDAAGWTSPKPQEAGFSYYTNFHYTADCEAVGSADGAGLLGGNLYSVSRATTPVCDIHFSRGSMTDLISGSERLTYSMAGGSTCYDGRAISYSNHNLITASEDLSDAAWVKTACSVVANDTTAPDGLITADRISSTNTGLSSLGRLNTGWSSVLTCRSIHTFSVYLKSSGTSRYALIRLASNTVPATEVTIEFDLIDGVVSQALTPAGSYSNVGFKYDALDNGWYRLAITGRNDEINSINVTIVPRDVSGNDNSAIGNGFYVWGGQICLGPEAGDYIQTTSAAVSRPCYAAIPATNGVPHKGIQVEEAKTNHTYNSTSMHLMGVTGPATVTRATDVFAPDGTLTAAFVADSDTSTNFRGIAPANSGTTNTRYTFSVYAKAGRPGKNRFTLNFSVVGLLVVYRLDNLTGTASVTVSGGSPFVRIERCDNGWFRCIASFTTNANANPAYHVLILSDDSNATSYTGVPGSGMYFWGAQLELGNNSSSLIPTGNTALTRAAVNLSATGSNLTSIYNQTTGTIYMETMGNRADDTNLLATQAGNRVLGFSASRQVNTSNSAGGLLQDGGQYGALGVYPRVAYAYDGTGRSICANGRTVVTDANTNSTGATTLHVGSNQSQALALNGVITRLTFWNSRLSDGDIQLITKTT